MTNEGLRVGPREVSCAASRKQFCRKGFGSCRRACERLWKFKSYGSCRRKRERKPTDFCIRNERAIVSREDRVEKIPYGQIAAIYRSIAAANLDRPVPRLFIV